MSGVLINTLAVIVGSIIGLIFNKGISKKIVDAVMIGIGLCTIYIGLSGALKGKNTLILIISMVIGSALGTWLDIDGKLNRLAEYAEKKYKSPTGKGISIAEGFITGSLLFCVGAMSIIGSLNAGLSGDNKMLYTKSILDFISSAMLSVSLGVGVLASSLFVLVFQGGIVLLSQFLQPILTASAIAEITCAGSLVIFALGLNLIGVTKIKVANYIPSIIVAPVLCWLAALI